MSFDWSRMWTRQPSYELCVKECGGKCCTGQTGVNVVWLESVDEATRIVKLAGGFMRFVDGKDDGKLGMLGMKLPCVFLEEGACSIHEQRPNACRIYPNRPTSGCAVWEV